MSGAIYEHVVRPLLFLLNPETAHHAAVGCLRLLARNGAALRALTPAQDPRLARTVFGVKFPNPVGLAAGFDKNALALPAWEALGMGFVEAGTITARPQPGNPRPRIFRIPEQQALINRMGFNNDGADVVAARLQRIRKLNRWPKIPVGINIGKSKVAPIEEATADYLYSFEKLHAFADYLVLNVSSPNTPGLRSLQNKAELDELLREVQALNARTRPAPKPLLLKIAPDVAFSQIEEIIGVAVEHRLAGIVATNTTLDHSSVPGAQRQEGGLSGRPLRQRSTEIIRFIAARTSLPIIGVGGIDSGEAAIEKLDAGAALVQIYTGFIYRGVRLPAEISKALCNARSAASPRA